MCAGRITWEAHAGGGIDDDGTQTGSGSIQATFLCTLGSFHGCHIPAPWSALREEGFLNIFRRKRKCMDNLNPVSIFPTGADLDKFMLGTELAERKTNQTRLLENPHFPAKVD